MEEDASTSGNSNISPQLVNEWIEIQDSLKKRLITDDEFDWKLPPMKDQDSEGMEENQDSNVEILKYVGGVDLSFSRNDSLIACATLVVLDISTLEVVHEDSSIIKLRIPYVPGFLAFREAPVLLELLKKMETTSPTLYPQVLMVDGNGLLHPRGFGLACHLGVLADLPTIGIGKNLVIVYLFRVPSRLSSCLVGFGFQNPSGRLTLDQRIFFESMA
ncbi:endonuclease V isoform X8 [Sesamum indicum]|uniref:Endonuclease V isoform X8 n=1 Tax=Sesamum indicum TaxID=4182 RepID=A0A8M8UUV9_SESIN|nr:endonuclease V isoform X8 [Sesamum indicum]